MFCKTDFILGSPIEALNVDCASGSVLMKARLINHISKKIDFICYDTNTGTPLANLYLLRKQMIVMITTKFQANARSIKNHLITIALNRPLDISTVI